MRGTRKRREHLKQCKFFECDCLRCKDPTELGTYFSALKCSQCSSGNFLSSDPLTPEAEWHCDNKKCRTTFTAASVNTIVDRIDTEIKSLDHNNIQHLEAGIQRYAKVLHKNHFLIIGLKYTLSQLYGKTVGFIIHQMSESMLERKKQICEDILQVFDILEPGLTRIRGLALYELHAPLMILTIQKFEMKKLSKQDLCRKLRKVALYLRECSQIFKHETKTSEGGILRVAAEDALIQLKSWEQVAGKL